MDKEKISNYVIGGLMVAAVAVILFLTFFRGESNEAVEAQTFSDVFSVNDPEKAYQTIGLQEVKAILDDKKTQVLFIGCRSCPHCNNYQSVVEDVIKNSLDGDRHQIQHWEAGYQCYPKQDDPDFELYMDLASEILGQEGVPQTVLLKDGKVEDRQVGALPADELKAFLAKHGYEVK